MSVKNLYLASESLPKKCPNCSAPGNIHKSKRYGLREDLGTFTDMDGKTWHLFKCKVCRFEIRKAEL